MSGEASASIWWGNMGKRGSQPLEGPLDGQSSHSVTCVEERIAGVVEVTCASVSAQSNPAKVEAATEAGAFLFVGAPTAALFLASEDDFHLAPRIAAFCERWFPVDGDAFSLAACEGLVGFEKVRFLRPGHGPRQFVSDVGDLDLMLAMALDLDRQSSFA